MIKFFFPSLNSKSGVWGALDAYLNKNSTFPLSGVLLTRFPAKIRNFRSLGCLRRVFEQKFEISVVWRSFDAFSGKTSEFQMTGVSETRFKVEKWKFHYLAHL